MKKMSSSGALWVLGMSLIVMPALTLAQPVYEEDDRTIELGPEYSDYEAPAGTRAGDDEDLGESLLLYLPNRVLDLIDIFRVDVGVGPALGAVVRVTKYGQVGYRQLVPGSVRVGLQGRDLPLFIETSNEVGIGPAFATSADRNIGSFELGVGADLFVAGAYAGVRLDQFVDFVLGWFFIDIEDDDLE